MVSTVVRRIYRLPGPLDHSIDKLRCHRPQPRVAGCWASAAGESANANLTTDKELMKTKRRSLLLLAAALLAVAPLTFGLIRAVSTGDDMRYLWLALASFLGATTVIPRGRGASGAARISLVRTLGAVGAGTVGAAAAAILQGATAGPGLRPGARHLFGGVRTRVRRAANFRERIT